MLKYSNVLPFKKLVKQSAPQGVFDFHYVWLKRVTHKHCCLVCILHDFNAHNYPFEYYVKRFRIGLLTNSLDFCKENEKTINVVKEL
jgi:hypothetical protein